MDLFRSREFSVYTQKLLKRHNVPGVAVGIVQGGKMASVAFGKASLDTPKIFNPLEMRSTYLFLDRVRSQGQSHRVATGYSRHKSELRETHCSDGPESQGAGQIWSTVDDYLKWIQAMLQFKGPITENIVKAVTTKWIRQNPDEDEGEANLDTWYALGWQVHEYGGHEIVSHEGREPGYQCNQFFLPDFNFGGVIFCNSYDADTTVSRLMYKLIDEVAHAGSSGVSHDDDDDDESEAGSVSGSDSDAEADNEEYEEELRQELSPGIGKPQPPTLPLSAYTRQYWHPGYHRLKTKYIGYMAQSFEPLDMPIKAEFRLENHRAFRLGIHLEARIDDYIWFDKLER